MANKPVYELLKDACDVLESWTDEKIKKTVVNDYLNLIDLRNRIADGTDDDTTLYEEDHLTLDHILDYMEVFIKVIIGEEMK